MSLLRLFIINVLTAISSFCYSQRIDSISKNIDVSDKYYSKVDSKLSLINKQLTKKSTKYLQKLERREKKLQEKLQLLNPEASANLFARTKEKYNQFASGLKNRAGKLNNIASGQYNPYLDSLGTSLSFLKQFQSITDKATTPLNSLQQLQGKLQQSENIKQYISERKEQIKQVLSTYTKLPGGLKKQLTKLNKNAYYYSAQVNECKQMLKDPAKAERKALSLLNQLSAFQKFMRKNSQLALLFRMPDNDISPQSTAGLQTRASVQALVQQQISGSGANAQQVIKQNIAQAKNELDKVKDKVNKLGGGGSDAEILEFKVNNQKTKTFLKRLEFGANVQSQKTNGLLPVTSDLAFTAGYKLNDKSVIGIGVAYKLGWGSGWRHIKLSHEGVGLRSFINYKMKRNFWVSGGYEKNYQQAFTRVEQLKTLNKWQTGGLIGLTKKYKAVKKTNSLQLLWDFLSYQQVPRTQPILFRIGYII